MDQQIKQQGCVLKATAINGRWHGLLGEITIAQTYQNSEAVNIEAVFTFPVPVEAVLLGVDIRIDDRVLQGRVMPKRQAENAYEDAVSAGDGAVLLQTAGRGLYTINVGNLLPGQTAHLSYRYTLLSVWNGDTLRLLLPTTIAPRYGNPGKAGLQPHQIPSVVVAADNRFSLQLELGGILRQAAVESPSHRICVAAETDMLRVQLASDQAWMDRDFILNIRVAPEARAASGWYAPDRNGGWAALLSFQPDLTSHSNQGGRDYVLVADCSGSMAGDSIAQTRQALLAILDRLQSADRFNLIAFGNQPRAFFSGLRPADASALVQARSSAAGLNADMGGTEIGAALQLAYRQRRDDQSLDILLMTDGEAWPVEALIADAQRSGCRIFTIGVGAAVAEGLIRGLADATGGACEFVHPNENMAARIVRHFERIRVPHAEATLAWPTEPTRQSPANIKQVFSDDTLHVSAWLPTLPEGPATLNLTLSDGRRLSQNARLEPWPTAEAVDTLPRLAAARYIAHLSADDATMLAVEYQLVTPHTHFLMVDVRAEHEKAKELPELRTVVHRLAAGWGGVGRVTDLAGYADIERTVRLRRPATEFAGSVPWGARHAVPSLSSAEPFADDVPVMGAMRPPAAERAVFDASPPSPVAAAPKSLLSKIGSLFRALMETIRSVKTKKRADVHQNRRRPDVQPSVPPAETATSSPTMFARWLEANAARLADLEQPLPVLDVLFSTAGLPDDLRAQLQAFVAQGEAEEAVVAALLHAFLQHGPECRLPRNLSRALRSRFQKQALTALAAVIESLVRNWCAAA